MHQFIHGSDDAWAQLERRASAHCIRFRDQCMPPGCQPSHAHVGFEVDAGSRAAILYVQTGVRYTGQNRELRRWLSRGEKRFPHFHALREWIVSDLAPVYPADAGQPDSSAPAVAQLTDLSTIQQLQAVQAGTHSAPHVDSSRFAEELRRHVFGQDHVLRPLAEQVCRHVARIDPRRPCTCWFAGPTGVGKTRTAALVSKVIQTLDPRKIGYSYTRLDMSEYGESHRRSQLLGAPQGYVGHGEGAQLVDDLAVNPRRVVLFDEIEKAHPTILQTLMNAMDAGRLSSPSRTATGTREVDCRRAIFIFTANLDSDGIVAELARTESFDDSVRTDEVCRSHVRAAGIAPELVGRINRFFVFRPLSTNALTEIAASAVHAVAQEYGVNVAYIEPAVIVRILEHTRSQVFGARPYEYAIDAILGNALVEAGASGSPVRVCAGPPLTCVPIELPHANARAGVNPSTAPGGIQ